MMHFLLRTSNAAADQAPPISQTSSESSDASKPVTTLEGLFSEDKFALYYETEDRELEARLLGTENGSMAASTETEFTSVKDKHVDVTEDVGWITIPCRELPTNWNETPDAKSLHSLDRSFVFPGEQVHILACLSTSKQDSEIITPFKVAAIMNKNGTGQVVKNQNGSVLEDESVSEAGQTTTNDPVDPLCENISVEASNPQTDVSASESLLRMEEHKRKTESIMQKFEDSHFFVRIADSAEPLWSKRSFPEASDSFATEFVTDADENVRASPSSSIHAAIDRGRFDARVSGGVARNSVKCCSLSNGDIVVLLEVNVGAEQLEDPVLEILQFEKYQDRMPTPQNGEESISEEHDPCDELLKWLLPLDNSSLPPMNRPLSPPLASVSHKASFSGSTGSQLFSFGHFRSYSMSSLSTVAPNTAAPPVSSTSKPNFDLGEWDRYGNPNLVKSQKVGTEGLLSFRGSPLEPERFSVRCGLEGIYVPGRRWRRQLEIIQPVDIHTFSADCNTEDLLCVQIKNVSPGHIPDIVIYLDAITVIFEEASKTGPPLGIPVACIEAGTNHCLPNLALRRGEEHSFILKPATSMLNRVLRNDKVSQPSRGRNGSTKVNIQLPPKFSKGKSNMSSADQYAVLVSCRCNYTESKMFFKKSISWRPRISRDLMLSVASEMSKQALEHDGNVSQLPVQVLTLQASNLTSEDLTLTILAPTSFTSPPSVLSLNSSQPSSPMSPFVGFSTTERLSSMPLLVQNQKQNGVLGARSISFDEQAISDVIPTTALSCNHLWLQSRVPLGNVPSQSTATVKLELLPLTDGIITLDTLQINVKQKGLIYVPEQSLKINATSSIATGIM